MRTSPRSTLPGSTSAPRCQARHQATPGAACRRHGCSAGTVLGWAVVLDRDDPCVGRALDRVQSKVRPSHAGMVKDSIHLEHYLELCRQLHASGFPERRMLVSANKADFWEAKHKADIHPDLEPQLSAVGLEFFGTLEAASEVWASEGRSLVSFPCCGLLLGHLSRPLGREPKLPDGVRGASASSPLRRDARDLTPVLGKRSHPVVAGEKRGTYCPCRPNVGSIWLPGDFFASGGRATH